MGFVEQETLHLDVTSLPMTASAALRAPSASEKLILEPGRPGMRDALQIVLYVDEDGGMSWHLPDGLSVGSAKSKESAETGEFRSTTKAVFTIPTRTAVARRAIDSGQTDMRGWITAIGLKVLKVLVIPLVSDLLASPIEKIVGAVERKHAQNLIRPIDLENYRRGNSHGTPPDLVLRIMRA
jgi:hypothetical protein